MKIIISCFISFVFTFSLFSQANIDSGGDLFKNFLKLEEDGIKYYIKVVPGDTNFGKNMPLITPMPDDLAENDLEIIDQIPNFKPPRALIKPKPEIPEEVKITSEVKIYVTCKVDKNGDPKNIKVVRSNAKHLNKLVIDTVKKWKFEPATIENKKIETSIIIPFEFSPKN